ncbi:SpoIIE family protein phosphatase [Stackebrandtia soli]|uniref:SpoIIE family protein phosphatase n=1 Tax=Stackebrandtia soli TaxID=1892856 RepID=UPI0039EC1691
MGGTPKPHGSTVTAKTAAMAGGRPDFTGDLRIATVIVDAQGRISYFSPQAEELTGFKRSEVIGRDLRVLTSTSAAFDTERFLRSPRSGAPEIQQIRRADGGSRTVILYRHPVPQPVGPPALLLQGIDAAAQATGDAGLAILNAFFQQSTMGFAILDPQLRFIAVNDTLAAYHHRDAEDHIGRNLREVHDSTDMDVYLSLLRAVLKTGKPVTNLHIPGRPTAEPGAEQVWSVSWYRLTEPPATPIGLCGVISDITRSDQATLDAARSRSRLALLNRIGARQDTTLDFRTAAQNLAETLTNEFADLASVDLVHDILAGEAPPDFIEDDTLISRVGASARQTSQDIETLLGTTNPRPVSHTSAFAAVLAANQPRLFQVPPAAQLPSALLRNPERASAMGALHNASMLIAPLRARNMTLGALTCARFEGREPFDDEDLLLLKDIADRTALSIDNSRLYAMERQTALTLQLSLLPRKLPNVPEVDVIYRYQPNRTDLRAGGDWFDVIVQPGRRIAFIVGDVAGHSISAAAAMGHYRTAVRSLASIGLEPAALLTRLNELALGLTDEVTATCVYVLYDPVQHWCVMASAGHPPPIIALPGETATATEIAGGPLLGAIEDATYQATALETPPGTRLLLYSDGVVESRQNGFDAAISRLARRMHTRMPPGQLLDRIMAESPSIEDDRTVLLAQLRGLIPHLHNTDLASVAVAARAGPPSGITSGVARRTR